MTQLTTDQALQAAFALHKSGRLAEAESIYRRVLAAQPNQADAQHLLGLLVAQAGKLEMGIDMVRRAVALQPNHFWAYSNLGKLLTGAGRFEEARAASARAIELNPTYAGAYSILGNALRELGRLDEAIAVLDRALAMEPGQSEAHANRGAALAAKGLQAGAIAAYRRAIELDPTMAMAQNNLGNALADLGRTDEAIEVFRAFHHVKSDFADSHYNLGNLLLVTNQIDGAIAEFRRAIELNPTLAMAQNNLANALASLERTDEAIEIFRALHRLNLDFADSHYNLGNLLATNNRFDEATAEFRRAKELTSVDIKLDWVQRNLTVSLFDGKKYQESWEEIDKLYDMRRKRVFSKPKWNGQDAAGKTILVYTELGFGDSIQFVRLIPTLKIPGARIILECEPALATLFRDLLGTDRVVARGIGSLEYDWHLPLMTLPKIIGLTLDEIPGSVPYLRAPAERVAEWKRRLEPYKQRKVGLVWAGSTTGMARRSRSLEIYRRLADIPGLHLLSLQKESTNELALMDEMRIIDFTAELHDFGETAALIENLDLVISVDSAVAHLAGALGKPVWTLVPWRGYYLFMQDRTDSPWYPTMRLFRQKVQDDWREVSESLAQSLAEFPA